jgi:hypothetical protein
MEQARTPRLELLHGGSASDLLPTTREGDRPMLALPLRGAGGHLLVLDRVPAYVELEPEKFDSYLQEEGLGHIVPERARLGEAAKPGRERYRRNLKALFQVGTTRDDTATRTVGQTLELVPDRDPSFAAPGDTLTVRITFRGAPVSGLAVDALSRGASADGVSSVYARRYTTDRDGKVAIAIDRRGAWLVRTVHMTRCETECEDADWDSYWAAYSFGNTAIAGASSASSSASRLWIVIAIGVAVVLGVLGFLVRRARRR